MRNTLQVLFLRTLLVLTFGSMATAGFRQTADWPVAGGDSSGSRYSPLREIHRGNVSRLRVAWVYRHGDFRSGGRLPDRWFKGTSFEATPLVVEGRLLFSTPFNRVIALDPESGRELWTFDPKLDRSRRFANGMVSRGVAYWLDSRSQGLCSRRVLLGTLDARLIALDAATGRPCADFGKSGVVDLLEGIEPLVDAWEYNVTSPPTVVGDLVVVGSSIADVVRRVQPSGAVRAYDVRSGALRWRFDTIPRTGQFGADTWENDSGRHHGGANVWSTMTADLERGLLFLPVSAAGPDFYGGDRAGANLFSDSLVALNAATGERVWHFQTVHHDLWDYDLAAPPNLVRLSLNGWYVDAVAQATKTGFVFVFDRETGEPLFPIEERPYPESDVEGERSHRTQPFPRKPPPLVPQRLTEEDLWKADPERWRRCREKLSSVRNEGIFTPPSERGSILYPYTGGGANWSGAAWDPETGVLYVPLNNLAHTILLEKLPDSNFEKEDRRVLRGGLSGLLWAITGRGTGLRYRMVRELFAVDGVPCNAPPWGWLVAVDLAHGEIRWKVPVGRDENGVEGLPNFGPPLVTAGGLVFHAGSREQTLRAHDALTGELLASFPLPAGLHAGPITYKIRSDSKQYLVVAPGGHTGLGSRLGDYVIAYVLDES